MLGNLWFSDIAILAEAFPCGTLRSKQRGYTVKPIVDDNRNGNPEPIGYEVEANSLVLTLDANFLTADEWHFWIKFPLVPNWIYLGVRKYMIDYDGLITRNGIEYHEIKLKFNIGADEYADYAIPV